VVCAVARVVFHEKYAEKFYVFRDRFDAGAKLGEWLSELGVGVDIVYGIPAGGVPVAYMVAEKINAKLDVLVCRKVLIPWNREAGFGAVAPDGSYFIDWEFARLLRLSSREVEAAVKEQLVEVERRLAKYRCGEPYSRLDGLRVLVVDDGIAAGYTMRAAVQFLEKMGVSEVAVAAPTCHPETLPRIESVKLSSIYCMNPRSTPVFAVADAYIEWTDLEDEDVIAVLRRALEKGLLAFSGVCLS